MQVRIIRLNQRGLQMAGYWIVRGAEIRDADALQEYGKLWSPIAAQFGAELIAGKGRVETPEGPQYARILLLKK
jgi:uncharacterized protein (DUF1330 family)